MSRGIFFSLALTACLPALLLPGGCGPAEQVAPSVEITAPPILPDEDCDPLPGIPRRGGTIIFALSEDVKPGRAPVPHNVSERLVFRNLYETLVQVTCQGQLRPALAESWESSQGYRIWVFTLKKGLRFWDGSELTAEDVKRCWIERQASSRLGGLHSPLTWLNARAASVRVLDPSRLVFTLPEPQADFPLLLAHAALAVAVRRPGWGWPVGTGACRLEPTAGHPAPDLVCLPNERRSDAPVWDRLVFRVLPGRDPRDLLGSDCDVLLVRDRSVLSYFESTAGVTVTPLPWDRLYLILCPPDGDPLERLRWYTGWDRSELARDVVAAAARNATDPFFLSPTERLCPQMTGPVESLDWPSFTWEEATATLDRDLILHPAGDEDARRLAERIAVLAGRPRGPAPDRPGRGPLSRPWPPADAEAPQAVAVPPADFPGAVQSERAGAYLLPLARNYPSACLQLASLLGLAEWIQNVGLDTDLPDTRFPGSARAGTPTDDFDLAEVTRAARRLQVSGVAVPIVVTRPHLVTKGRLVGLELAFDGTPLLARSGWARAGSMP